MDAFNLSSLTQALEIANNENPYDALPNDCSPIAVTTNASEFSFYMDTGSGCLTAQPIQSLNFKGNEYYSVYGRPIMSVSRSQGAPAPFFIAFISRGQLIVKYGWIVNKTTGKNKIAISFDELMKKVRNKNCSTETKMVMDNLTGELSQLLGKRTRSFGSKTFSIKSIKNMLRIVNRYV